MLRGLVALSCLTIALGSTPALALGEDRGGVERLGDDTAELWAEDGGAGPGGEPTPGCSAWESVWLSDMVGAPWAPLPVMEGDDRPITHDGDDGVVEALWVRECDHLPERREYAWFDVAPSLQPMLARAREELAPPMPVPGFAPPAERVQTLVGVDTWFWVSPWQPVQSTVTAGGVTVWAEARPVRLTFDPGDGEPVVECVGPGGVDTDCGHRYQLMSSHHVSGRWPASLSVQWEVTWTSNIGLDGALDPLVTTAEVPLTVGEAVVVLRR